MKKELFIVCISKISARRRESPVSLSMNTGVDRLLGQRYEIAPLYDLVCTAIYPKLQKHFAFSIGGQNDYTQIGKKELKLLDRQLEFKEGTCQERMQAMHQKITQHKSTNREQITKEYGKISLLERIEEVIEARARTFANQKAIDIKS